MAKQKKLYRSNKDKKIAGVCAGLGDYLNIDPTVVRVLFILLLIVTAVFPAVIGYLLMAMIIPANPDEDK